ncbi:exosortase-dependent surface protein XDP1 [Uliginosibacterium sp. H1]|uniref:exosortase-dependent surface protein XDP1 n=1 Tax=Uliginosibacterium sp. H1 TaxID=3114757 RepID=UPI002E19EC13|nr:exosortase-dependent surface protein XDP1 [Uliginosibacterium sp. H1]
MNRIIVTATVALGFMASMPASAEVSWSFSSSSCSNGVGNSLYGSCSSTGSPSSAPDVTARAYSNTGGNSWTGTDSANGATNPSRSNLQTIEQAYVGVYSSNPGELGVTNYDATSRSGQIIDTSEGSNPEHSLDNNQRYDSLLFSFTSAIQLTAVQMGWWSGDSDITLLAYTGALNQDGSIPSSKLIGLTYSSLLTNGWVLVNSYSNVQSNKTVVNAGGISSQHWLLGAYNPLGGSAAYSQGDDNVKVKYLFGEYSTSSSSSSSSSGGTVPEPGSLLLVSLSVAALAGLRKRRQV